MTAGKGKPGFCSLCAHPAAPAINRMVKAGANAAKINAFLTENFGRGADRKTIYAHKPHALSPEEKVIQIAEQGKKALTIRKTSNTAFLESLRDIGFSQAIEDPDRISIDHALKAVQILEGRKDRGGDQLNILIAISTGQRPAIVIDDPSVIEGEAQEVS